MSGDPSRILLVDDDPEHLATLASEVVGALGGQSELVAAWRPLRHEDVFGEFERQLEGDRVTLVVTDYDLTREGPSGFFGASIVAWCQQRAVPVGDYSRGNRPRLPDRPNVFEFRFPPTPSDAAAQIAGVYRGFRDLRSSLTKRPNLLSTASPANMLAELLEHPSAISSFALYTSEIRGNASLVDLLRADTSRRGRERLACYILGHLLFNSILRYPGPLMDGAALCAYFAVSPEEARKIAPLFEAALFEGPFRELGPFFWRDEIDSVTEEWADQMDLPYTGEPASYRRELLQQQIGNHHLLRYQCPRCLGERGGFRCPFTGAVVCELSDCSVSSSGWIPQGAELSRVERSFYDELAPMLGT